MPLAPPTNVTATAGPGYVKVEWTHSGQDVQNFNVIRQGGVTGQQTAPYATVEASERSFIDDEIDLGETYQYSVVAVGASATSEATPHAGGGAVVEPGIDVVVGQWNAPGDPAAIFAIYLFVPETDWPEAGATRAVTVTGPSSFSRTFELGRFEFTTGFTSLVAPGPLTAGGEYTLSLTVGTTTYSAMATYDPDLAIERPLVAPVSNPSSDGVELAWEAVPGAVTYSASLSLDETERYVLGSNRLTASPSSHITGLDLASAVYYAEVIAYTWDAIAAGAGRIPEKPAAANASRSNRQYFAVPDLNACADPNALVSIPDVILREEILRIHGFAGPSPTCAEMQQVLQLIVPQRGITSLEGLQHAIFLYNLSIYGNEITDLSPLADLTGLLAIFAHGNPITSLEPVAGLTALRFIEVTDNDISDLSPLTGLSDLVRVGAARLPNVTDISPLAGKPIAWLWLNGSENIADFSVISGFTNLNTLLVGNTGFDDTDMLMLPALTSLGRLQLWSNVGVSDLGPVTDLPLYEIDVGGTSVTDLTPLYGKADTMQNLSAYSLGLSNTDIEFLTNFTNLRSLNLGGNELNDLSSLVANAGLGEGDTLTINNNCLDLSVGSTASLQIEALEGRGVEVLYEPQRTCVP